MFGSLYAICVWNWNWWLTKDHFLIKHWRERTHRCSAFRCWPWGVFIGAGQPLQHGEVRDTNLAWVRPVGWRAPKTATPATPVSEVTWPRSRFNTSGPDPPGVWLGGPGCKPAHSRRSWWSSPHLTASGLIPVMSSYVITTNRQF